MSLSLITLTVGAPSVERARRQLGVALPARRTPLGCGQLTASLHQQQGGSGSICASFVDDHDAPDVVGEAARQRNSALLAVPPSLLNAYNVTALERAKQLICERALVGRRHLD
ncbi:MAG: hypothetical protein ACRDS9_06485 [Pseudonocardiaceae bacterium]